MVKVHNFVEYFNAVEKISQSCNKDEMLFYRGISDATFDLLPGIKFEKKVTEYDEYHNLLLEYPDEFNTKDHLGTLAKMQHYGANTRLLDVSDNILTALFFASEQKQDCDGKVWVFRVPKREILHHNSDKAMMLACLPAIREADKERIKQFCETHRGEITDQQIVGHPEMIKFLHEIRGEYPAFETAIVGQDILDCFFVQANKNNVRMRVQSGYFVICGLADERTCKQKLETHVVEEIIIDKNKKTQILEELSLMNIRSDTVYPDLERTAIYLRNKKLGWKDIKE